MNAGSIFVCAAVVWAAIRSQAIAHAAASIDAQDSLIARAARESGAPLPERLLRAGLVDVATIDSSLAIDLVYGHPDNFFGEDLYGSLDRCYLRPEAARMLAHAHRLLRDRRPELRLLVLDCARPRSVQRMMWRVVRDTPLEAYVASPARGSMHNYGMAVDLTLADSTGRALDMGSRFDELGPRAQPRQEERLLRAGVLTRDQVERRRLLRDVMVKAGFVSLAIEWWHFDAGSKKSVREKYRIIE